MKNKTVAGLLALVFGYLGLHRFYLGETGNGCAFLVLGLLFTPFVWLVALYDAYQLLTMDDAVFDARYNHHVPLPTQLAGADSLPQGQPARAGGAPRRPADWWQQARPRTVADRERIVLAMVQANGGHATPAEVAVQTQVSLQQARDVLRELELLGVCQTEYDAQSGLPRYLFPEFQESRLTGDERQEDQLGLRL